MAARTTMTFCGDKKCALLLYAVLLGLSSADDEDHSNQSREGPLYLLGRFLFALGGQPVTVWQSWAILISCPLGVGVCFFYGINSARSIHPYSQLSQSDLVRVALFGLRL